MPLRIPENHGPRAPRLVGGLLEHFGSGGPDLFEGGVEIVRAEDRGLQRPLGDERQEGVAFGFRPTPVFSATKWPSEKAGLTSLNSSGD